MAVASDGGNTDPANNRIYYPTSSEWWYSESVDCIVDGECISTPGETGPIESCSVYALRDLYIHAACFDTEPGVDVFTVAGTSYSGTDGPHGVHVSATTCQPWAEASTCQPDDRMTWSTSRYGASAGFTLCAVGSADELSRSFECFGNRPPSAAWSPRPIDVSFLRKAALGCGLFAPPFLVYALYERYLGPWQRWPWQKAPSPTEPQASKAAAPGPEGAADDGLAGGGDDGVIVKGEPTLDC